METNIVQGDSFVTKQKPYNSIGEKKVEPVMLSGIRKEWAEFIVRLHMGRIAFRHFKNPFVLFRTLRKLDQLRRQVLGDNRLKKIAKVDGKYYWDLYTPGCPSVAFTRYIEGEIHRFLPLKRSGNRFTNVFLAITKKCSLRCEHCYEWESLNKKEVMGLEDLKLVTAQLQEQGIGQIQFSGGEPLLRIKDLNEVMQSAKKTTEFWINTSGHKFTHQNAYRLKEHGLTGATISLDHFEENHHNLFRGNPKSYDWAISATKNAQKEGIVTGLSLCATKSFVTEDNLMNYLKLAKRMGVSFVQILEPRAVGHYQGHCVDLNPTHLKILENFYRLVNYDPKFKNYPIVTYHGFHQRRVGCFASGNRSFYVDTNGDIHACPFCQKKSGSALSPEFKNSITSLKKAGCHAFDGATI